MSNPIEFTDGYRKANCFVKELYIGSKWDQVAYTGNMRLWQARNETHPDGFLISIGLEYEYNGQTGMKHGFLSVQNGTSGPIKFDSKGMFKGVDCYIVVDWSVFSDPAWQTDQINGEICFGAVIYMDVATNIDNSPTIKKYLYEQALGNFSPPLLPTCEFSRTVPTSPQVSETIINVYNCTQLLDAIRNNNNVTINIQADIALSKDTSTTDNLTSDRNNGGSLNTLINIENKNIVFNGNNHKIYEYVNEINATQSGDRYYAPYNGNVTGDRAFVTEDGTLLPLAKSSMYKAGGWITFGNITNRFGLYMPSELINLYNIDTDNVFICYRLSYHRYMKRIVEAHQGYVVIEVTEENDDTSNAYFRDTLTPYPDFFLVNYAGDGNGVLIKNAVLSYPASYGINRISPCWAEHLFRIKYNSHVEFNNVKFIGGIDYSVRNDYKLSFYQCHFTNCIAGSIFNLRQLFVDHCEFTDVMSYAVRFEHMEGSYYSTPPYMEVTNCMFKNIGHYGTNVFAVKNTGKAYVADNEFVDTNYGAIYTGQCNCDSELTLFSESLIERNYIHYTPEWVEKRKVLGLQDSGDIYITTNNKKAIIRFNRIVGTGGVTGTDGKRKNNGIYGDDGAYNMKIYCNVISGTENYYDIDCRDVSGNVTRIIPTSDGFHVNTNNYIGYNLCDGYVRIQENTADELNNTDCMFVNNFMLNKTIETVVQSGVVTGNSYNQTVFCENSEGIVTDETGMIASSTIISLLGKCPLLSEQSSD